jgi:hypothetical protein
MKPASNQRSEGNGWGRIGIVFGPPIIVLLALLNSPALAAQQPPAPPLAAPLTVTSPAPLAVVHPGETLPIEVAVAPGAVFRFVTVVGEKSFGVSSPLGAGPYHFSFSVPEGLNSGPYYFTAVGRAVSGDMAVSLPLAVDVESGTSPLSLKPDPQVIDLEALGEDIPVRILGIFAGGTETDVTRSSLLHLTSSNPAVASVFPEGVVRAVAPGTARIMATFQSPAGAVRSEISATVHEFAVRLSANSLEFGNQPAGMESAARVLTLTNPGRSPLQIREVHASGDYQASGDCLSAGPVPSGGICTIAVTYVPSAEGSETGSLTIVTGAVSAATVVILSGTGVAR